LKDDYLVPFAIDELSHEEIHVVALNLAGRRASHKIDDLRDDIEYDPRLTNDPSGLWLSEEMERGLK